MEYILAIIFSGLFGGFVIYLLRKQKVKKYPETPVTKDYHEMSLEELRKEASNLNIYISGQDTKTNIIRKILQKEARL